MVSNVFRYYFLLERGIIGFAEDKRGKGIDREMAFGFF